MPKLRADMTIIGERTTVYFHEDGSMRIMIEGDDAMPVTASDHIPKDDVMSLVSTIAANLGYSLLYENQDAPTVVDNPRVSRDEQSVRPPEDR